MGRQLRRVPMDFAWPIHKVWDGFVNPHFKECGCESGSSIDGRWLESICHNLCILATDGQRGTLHPWSRELACSPEAPPTARFEEIIQGLLPEDRRKRSNGPFGHDAIDDRWAIQKAILKAAGLPEDWGTCQRCGGDNIAPEAKAAYEAWTETEPPPGDGWQMWETVSEGSPISPVFATAEELASWLAENNRGVDVGTTREQWLKMILGDGWSPSFILSERGFQTGVQALGDEP